MDRFGRACFANVGFRVVVGRLRCSVVTFNAPVLKQRCSILGNGSIRVLNVMPEDHSSLAWRRGMGLQRWFYPYSDFDGIQQVEVVGKFVGSKQKSIGAKANRIIVQCQHGNGKCEDVFI